MTWPDIRGLIHRGQGLDHTPPEDLGASPWPAPAEEGRLWLMCKNKIWGGGRRWQDTGWRGRQSFLRELVSRVWEPPTRPAWAADTGGRPAPGSWWLGQWGSRPGPRQGLAGSLSEPQGHRLPGLLGLGLGPPGGAAVAEALTAEGGRAAGRGSGVGARPGPGRQRPWGRAGSGQPAGRA